MADYERAKLSGDRSSRWFIRRYGTWAAATTAARLSAGSATPARWTDTQVLAAIRRCHRETGRPVTAASYETWRDGRTDRPTANRLRRYPGGISAAVRAAGLTAQRRGRNRTFTDQHIADTIRRAAADLGKPGLSAAGYERWRSAQSDRSTLPTVQSVIRRHGDRWTDARASAGIDPGPVPDPLDSVRAALAEDPSLSFRKYQAWHRMNPDSVPPRNLYKLFGSWSKALDQARSGR